MIEEIIYKDFDISEELQEASDKIVKIAFRILDELEDYHSVLAALSQYRIRLMITEEEQNGEEDNLPTLLTGELAENFYRDTYVKTMKKLVPHQSEYDILEGYSGYEIHWDAVHFTKDELKTLAACEIGKYRRLIDYHKRMAG